MKDGKVYGFKKNLPVFWHRAG